MYDEFPSNTDYGSIVKKVDWLEKKMAFKSFIINELKIKDQDIISRLLEEFNEGLNSNIDFRMLMFALDYDEEFVDNIVKKYNAGEKPRYAKYNDFFIPESSMVEEVSKLKSKKRYYYKRKPFDVSKIEELRQKAEEQLSNLKLANLDIMIDDTLPASLLDELVTINSEAIVYSSLHDLASDNRGVIPYYDNNILRSIVGIACQFNNDLIMLQDKFAIDNVLSSGGKIIGVLTSVDGNIEGFYKIEDVIKRGVTR